MPEQDEQQPSVSFSGDPERLKGGPGPQESTDAATDADADMASPSPSPLHGAGMVGSGGRLSTSAALQPDAAPGEVPTQATPLAAALLAPQAAAQAAPQAAQQEPAPAASWPPAKWAIVAPPKPPLVVVSAASSLDIHVVAALRNLHNEAVADYGIGFTHSEIARRAPLGQGCLPRALCTYPGGRCVRLSCLAAPSVFVFFKKTPEN